MRPCKRPALALPASPRAEASVPANSLLTADCDAVPAPSLGTCPPTGPGLLPGAHLLLLTLLCFLFSAQASGDPCTPRGQGLPRLRPELRRFLAQCLLVSGGPRPCPIAPVPGFLRAPLPFPVCSQASSCLPPLLQGCCQSASWLRASLWSRSPSLSSDHITDGHFEIYASVLLFFI